MIKLLTEHFLEPLNLMTLAVFTLFTLTASFAGFNTKTPDSNYSIWIIFVSILFTRALISDIIDYAGDQLRRFEKLNLFFILHAMLMLAFLLPQHYIDTTESHIVFFIVIGILYGLAHRLARDSIVIPIHDHYKHYNGASEIIVTFLAGIGWSSLTLQLLGLIGPFDPIARFVTTIPLILTAGLLRSTETLR